MNEFVDLADLEDVFSPLRSPARPAELSQESATVDLMVKAHRTAEGKHMFTSRRARIATLAAAGVLGFGGMAAASSPSFLGDGPTVEPTAVVEVVVEVEDEFEDEQTVDPTDTGEETPVAAKPDEEVPAEEVPAAEVPAEELPAAEVPAEASAEDPDLDTAFDERYCVPGNHGKTVSAVARGEYTLGESPESVTVTEAAQSSCGKTGEVDGDEIEEQRDVEIEIPTEIPTEVPTSVESEKSEAKAERPGKSDKGPEKVANGKSNGRRGG